AGDFDADRADHDPLDPLLGRERGLRFDRSDLPDESEYERQRANRADEGLADVDPRGDEVGYRGDVGFAGEEKHVRLQLFSRHATGRGGAREPSLLRPAQRRNLTLERETPRHAIAIDPGSCVYGRTVPTSGPT